MCEEEKSIEEFNFNKDICKICQSSIGYCKSNRNKRIHKNIFANNLFKEINKNVNKASKKFYGKLNSKKLKDPYIIEIIRSNTGLENKTIHEHPELIENYRQQIKLKRLLKQKKNDIKTS